MQSFTSHLFPQAVLHFGAYSPHCQEFNCYNLRDTTFTIAHCFFSNTIDTFAQRNRCLYHLPPILTEQCLTYIPLALTLKSSTFCSRLVFICFLWNSEKQQLLSLTVLTYSSLWRRGTVFAVSRSWPCVRHGGAWPRDPLSLNLGIRCRQNLVSSLGIFTTRNIFPGTDWIRGYVDTKVVVDVLGKIKISRICRESNTT
jgi:hypothetical protein